MADKENKIVLENGVVSYSSDVIATIAGLAAIEIEGVAGMSGNLVSGITEMLGKKDFTKGVKVDISGDNVSLEMNLIVKYGVEMHQVCRKVQEHVHKEIETMTNLNVAAVNVRVVGIDMKDNAQ